MGQKGFYYNKNNCIGCKVCQIACKDINGLEVGTDLRHVEYIEEGKYPNPKFYYISMSCNHCESPACVPVCPVKALTKDEKTGLVLQDQEKCIGCRACENACPYGAIQYIEAKGKTAKCDGCYKLVKKGEKPACVAGCVTRTLNFGDIDKLEKEYKNAKPFKNLGDTNPSFLIEE